LVLGGGVHAAEFAYARALERNEQSMLIVERGKVISANFGTAGDTFAINSSNRAQKVDEAPGPGRGNLNPIEAPYEVSMIRGRKFGSARDMADVSTVGTYASGADFLMEETVVKVYDRNREDPNNVEGWPGRYKAVMSSGRATYHDEVYVTTGLGVVA